MEKQPRGGERFTPTTPELSPEHKQSLEHKRGPEASAERPEKQAEKAREAIKKIEEEPKAEEAPKPKEPTDTPHPLSGIGRKLNYKTTVASMQQQLSPVSRSFSKVIHNPIVEAVSETAGKTIARPSVTLGATTTAVLIGGSIYFIARFYGYQLGSAELLICLIIGGAFGLLIEGISKLFRHDH